MHVVVSGELYFFDPSSSLDSGVMKICDHWEDVWEVVIQQVFLPGLKHRILGDERGVSENCGSWSCHEHLWTASRFCHAKDSYAGLI